MFYSLVFVFLASLFSWGVLFYFQKTAAIPKYGGEYIEGAAGQPIHINPILSQSNDIDRDLTQIIFNGLLKYDGEGKIIPDLAESWEISEDKTVYTVRLKEGITWHDGEPFTSSDVIFTINLLSDPSYRSPLRGSWQGIESNQIDERVLEFKIPSPYAGFLNNLTFGILPKHIWETSTAENFHLSNINLEPIGTGPFKFSQFQKDSKGNILSYKMVANPDYFESKPFISKITFNFYNDEESLMDAYNRKEVMGISGLSPEKTKEIKLSQSTEIHTFQIPRYFSVFMNQTKSVPLANDEVREALNLATDREDMIKTILDGKGIPVFSPFLPGMTGYSDEFRKDFDLERAKQILEEKNWKIGADGIREKDGVRLEISLDTTEELEETAKVLKRQWEELGARINVSGFPFSDIQQNHIRPREYEALLFGQVLSADPDPFSFWHSTEKKDPGLNLALFGKDDTDKLIEEGRAEFDFQKRNDLYMELQRKIQEETPAIFLYSPSYVYPVSKNVRGIEAKIMSSPSKRFCGVSKWYIKTKRIWK